MLTATKSITYQEFKEVEFEEWELCKSFGFANLEGKITFKVLEGLEIEVKEIFL